MMDKNEKETRIREYLSGELGEKEEREFNEWLVGDVEAQQIFKERVKQYDLIRWAKRWEYIDDFALATWAPIKKENKYTLDVFVDKCSVEIFLNGGKVAMTNLIFPSEPYNRMCFYSKGGSFQVDSFKAYRLGL